MDTADREILVRYRYLRRQRQYWDDAAPMVGRVAGLTQHLEWRDAPRREDSYLAPGDWPRQSIRDLVAPPQRIPPTNPDGSPGPVVPNPHLEEWRTRDVTFLRPILQAHQDVINWVEARVAEGVRAQYNIATRLAEIVLLHQKGSEELEQALDRLRKDGARDL